MLLLPGKLASRLRRQAAELLCKFLGGDVSLIDQVISNRRLQDDLAKNAPADPRRAFGEMVEQEPGMSIQRALEQALPPRLEQLFGTMTEQLCGKIEERFAALERRRPGPYALAAPGNNKPLTVPQYLAEKERQHPGFAAVRKSFAPNFSTLVSVLKHDAACRSTGRPAAQGKRAKDRPVLEHAWELARGYRESLSAARERPNIIEMLRGSA